MRTYLFQSLAFAFQRDTFIVDDVLEQLTDGIVRFLFALLFETLWGDLKTVGQWHRIVGLETDLIRAEKSSKKRKKPKQKKQKQNKKKRKKEMNYHHAIIIGIQCNKTH